MSARRQVAALTLVGCLHCACGGNDPWTPNPQPGSVLLELEPTVGGVELVTHDIRYSNRADNLYSVERLRLLLSNLELHAASGTTHAVAGPLYFTLEEPSSLSHLLTGIPPASYVSISFIFGLDETMNTSNAFVTETWHDAMAWPTPLGGGYHYMILDGFFRMLPTSADTLTYNTHLGRVGSENPHFFLVELPIDPITVDNNSQTIRLNMDINEWYENPNVYSFPQDPRIMNNNEVQNLLMQNGSSVFSAAPGE